MTKTITTYYCDRCGEKMAENPVFFCLTHPNTAIQVLRDEWKYANLCGKCKESFIAWWEKSSVSSTEEVEKMDGECSTCELEKESNTADPNYGKFVAC